ncbi:MAG: hypothetical protein NW207_08230 [Cytophagales bacterium]|nr:hypothetical protein [Cytophagales bacterium]
MKEIYAISKGTIIKNILPVIFIILISSCANEKVAPNNNIIPINTMVGMPKDTTKTDTLKTVVIPLDSQNVNMLIYDKNYILIEEGDTTTLTLTSVTGGVFNSISFIHTIQGISMDKKGNIKTEPTLKYGEYKPTIIVANKLSTYTFSGVVTITSLAIKVKSITFRKSIYEVNFGQYLQTDTPLVAGSKPATLLISSNSTIETFLVNNITGAIKAYPTTPPGDYIINFLAKNMKGTVTIDKVITVRVLGAGPPAGYTSFKDDVKPIFQNYCQRCHPGYINYITVYDNITNIYDRLNRKKGDSKLMPQNGEPIDTMELNVVKKWMNGGKYY